MNEIVGRKAELEVVERFVDAVPQAPSALVIDGDAGIGKTTLWLEALREIDLRGYRVLTARPAESEASLSYASLTDLIGHVFDEALPRLPEPQARALATVLLRGRPGERADPRTTSAGLVSVLAVLAAEAPLVVAVDDVHWLDPATARALEFAGRRLPAKTGLLLARRSEGLDGPPLRLDRALPEHRLLRIVLGPLSLGALHHLIAARLGAAPTRPRLTRILEASGGNPFFALEIARSLPPARARYGLADPLPVPPSLRELLAARFPDLPAPVHDLVLTAAALSRPTVTKLVAALAPAVDVASALLAAEEGGVLVSRHEHVRFTHPLLASAVYAAAAPSRRRELHRRLADVATDPEERARHLAAGVTLPDAAPASAIEEAAQAPAVRGAYDAAVELFEAAERLTPAEHVEERSRRALGQADAAFYIGDLEGARSHAGRVAAESSPSVRAQAFCLLLNVDWESGSLDDMDEHLEQWLLAASGDRTTQGEAHALFGQLTVALDPARALLEFDVAEEMLASKASAQGLARISFHRFWAEALVGREPRVELLQRALELEVDPWHPVPSLWFACTDDFDAARARHDAEDAWATIHGDDRTKGDRIAYRALVELRAGNWDVAERYAEESCDLVENLDAGRARAVAFGWRSLVDAHRGRADRARSTLGSLLAAAERADARSWWVERLLSILAFVEFSAGEHDAAGEALARMWNRYRATGVTEPLLDWSEPFHVESLLALGELAQAKHTLARLEQRGRRFPRLWIDVTLPRARALVLAAEGNLPAALAVLERLDAGTASKLPFELGWGMLVKGQLLRRTKQRRAAAAALSQALEIFEALEAPAWIDRTRAEVARVQPRRRASGELTATERLVAELAATGLTNREVAKAAFVSPKTVEANLARVYRKLGIRSRAELGAHLGGRRHAGDART